VCFENLYEEFDWQPSGINPSHFVGDSLISHWPSFEVDFTRQDSGFLISHGDKNFGD
jgi:hypothetical protein